MDQAPRVNLKTYLGQQVCVVVDRPLGSVHPRYPTLIYSVNYGEIPGTVSGDGEPIDVYLVGWDSPLEGALAWIVGVVVRADDVEDKLIGVPPGSTWIPEELWEAVRFQEQYFDSSLVTLLDK